ncbi:leucine-rich repeat domain-containing protein [Pontiellaceae bacterium B1224]|nr:leucine-rich repeat domain-containing protein [Pontiellaceae bacterium B1224]
MNGKKMGHGMFSTCVVLWLAAAVTAHAGTWGDLTYEISGNQINITDCDTSAIGELAIPGTIEGFPVRAIGADAFAGCSNLTSVAIPAGIRTIGDSAFVGCSGLTGVTIPADIRTIGRFVFEGCSGLTGVTISDGVAIIPPGMFKGCTGLTSVTIPDSAISIYGSVFEECHSLTNVTIGTDVTEIGDSAFEGCSGLTSITIPDAVTHFGRDVFKGTSLPTITSNSISYLLTATCAVLTDGSGVAGHSVIPDEINGLPVRFIGESAFKDCTGLTGLTIPDEVISIGDFAFENCYSLTNATIPDGVVFIGSHTFRKCSGLINMTIPDGVAVISGGLFYGCSGLTSVTIPDSVTCIEWSAFWGCSKLTNVTIPDGVGVLEDGTYEGCSSLTNVTIPDDATLIGGYTFAGCSALTSVTIPDGVATIESRAFEGCSGLTSLTIPDGVTYIGEDVFTGTSIPTITSNDMSYVLTTTCAVLTDGSGVAGNVTIPDEISGLPVRFIGEDAFAGCSDLTSVTIPDGVISIGVAAFDSCSGLTGVTIPDSVATIGSSAFKDCSGLTSVALGDGVMRIGTGSFDGTSIPTISSNGVSYLLTSTCAVLIDGGDPVGNLVLPNEVDGLPVRIIADHAFFGCYSLTSVTIPDSVTSIGYLAFVFCRGLTSLTIPESVTYIEEGAFYSCGSLTDITIPDGVTFIGRNAFGHTGVANVTIPSSVTYIGEGAFRGSFSLQTALFEGDAPETLGGGAFYLGVSSFYYISSDFTLQFYEGAGGFATPEWEGYPCEMLPSFGTWAMAYPDGQRNPADTPDGDGIPNLMKYATGLEPGTAYSSADLFTCAAADTPGNAVFAVTYYQDPAAFGVSLYPIASGTLTNAPAAWSEDGITTIDTGSRDAAGRNIWRAVLPTENDQGYLRLSAEVE